ncbi:DUF4037 domain-containing protein [Sutcliffiella sp. NC1]|uniref:DUF4037 domain-containing protein n=1 Tax=Sutcliffiella sp. NC1 TaxID=3004096 RepID=UPI0022DCF777|nr:DUF4037 domain-containing protein [Sutcliffiella sp. NC1]WBL16952.1 DUF4037 domain-containing protein [Sutcliffiella sp. NC1]
MNLKKLADVVAKIYKLNPKVEAVLLGGSVSRNWEDEYSDIELFVFWNEAPSDEDRKTPIKKVKGDIIDFHPFEDDEWSETYTTEEVKLEISNFLTHTIKQIIDDVTLSFDTDLDKQCIVATVHDGVSLSGDLVIKSMKEKVNSYPVELSLAMIEENIHLGNRWNNREALLNRKDWLMLYKVMVEVQTKVMGMLFGLNRQYVHHPAFKWQKQSLQSMDITPENIVNRLDSIFLDHPSNSVKELEDIIGDVYELIQREYPQIDLSSVIDKSLFLRPKREIRIMER